MKTSIIFLFATLFLGQLPAQPSIQWQKTYGGSDFDDAVGILDTNGGGFVIIGNTYSQDYDVLCQHGYGDFWISKIDAMGQIKWRVCLGGSDSDRPHAIKKTPDQGYIVIGTTQSDDGDIAENHGDKDAWVIKLNSMGGLEWQKSLGGSGWDEGRDIEPNSDGGYIVVGASESNDGDATVPIGNFLDYWIVKLNHLGELEWQKSYGGTLEDGANAVKQTIDGGYIVVGEAQSMNGDVVGNHGNVDYWIIKLRNNGAIEWQKALGGIGLDVAREILLLQEGYLILGESGSGNTGDVTNHHGDFDGWVIKLNLSGDLIWQKALGGSKADYAPAATLTPDGGLVVVGPTKSTDGDIQNFLGVQDISVYKLSKDGQLQWQKTIGGSEGDSAGAIQYTSDGGLILAGNTWSSDGDVTGSIIRGKNDFWVVKLSPESVATTQPEPNELAVYPNPANRWVSIQTPSGEINLELSITDMLGRQVLYSPRVTTSEIDLASLVPGLYIIAATTDSGKRYTGKLEKN